jgi:hypothetical protein
MQTKLLRLVPREAVRDGERAAHREGPHLVDEPRGDGPGERLVAAHRAIRGDGWSDLANAVHAAREVALEVPHRSGRVIRLDEEPLAETDEVLFREILGGDEAPTVLRHAPNTNSVSDIDEPFVAEH